MKALVGAFNQEKALVGAFSVITNLRMELFQALTITHLHSGNHESPVTVDIAAVAGPPPRPRPGLDPPGARDSAHQPARAPAPAPAAGHLPRPQPRPRPSYSFSGAGGEKYTMYIVTSPFSYQGTRACESSCNLREGSFEALIVTQIQFVFSGAQEWCRGPRQG